MRKRIFSDNVAAVYDQEQFERNLSEEEKQLLFCCLTSDVHGNFEKMMENRLEKYRKEDGSISKFGYIKSRLFPGEKFLSDNYPFFCKHKYLQPTLWFFRILKAIFKEKSRKNFIRELKALQK